MKDWLRIRRERDDLTDYIVHFTRCVFWTEETQTEFVSEFDVFCRILREVSRICIINPFCYPRSLLFSSSPTHSSAHGDP